MALTATAFFSSPAEQISPRAEDEFFTSLKVRNRNFKQTGTGRLEALNDLIVNYLDRNSRQVHEVLDVGISSGITTLELYDRLVKSGCHPNVLGTDLVLNAEIVDVLPFCRALIDDYGDVLQYEIFGKALRPWRRRLDYVTGMILVRGVVNRTCGTRARKLKTENAGPDRKRVALVSRRFSEQPCLRAVEDDVMIQNPALTRRFDLVRVANVLNKDYFDTAALRTGLRHVASYLSGPGALLLVARTGARSGHQATLFELQDDEQLRIVERIGAGSEIESVALEISSSKVT